MTPPTSMPPYSAACGCNPTARNSKPRRVLNRNHHSPIMAITARTITMLAAEPWNADDMSANRGSWPLLISAVCSVSGTCNRVDVR